MQGKVIKQINNQKITQDTKMYRVYDPNGTEIAQSMNLQAVVALCQRNKSYVNAGKSANLAAENSILQKQNEKLIEENDRLRQQISILRNHYR